MKSTGVRNSETDYSECHAPELMRAMRDLRTFEASVQAIPIKTTAGKAVRGQMTVGIDALRDQLEDLHGIQIGRPSNV